MGAAAVALLPSAWRGFYQPDLVGGTKMQDARSAIRWRQQSGRRSGLRRRRRCSTCLLPWAWSAWRQLPLRRIPNCRPPRGGNGSPSPSAAPGSRRDALYVEQRRSGRAIARWRPRRDHAPRRRHSGGGEGRGDPDHVRTAFHAGRADRRRCQLFGRRHLARPRSTGAGDRRRGSVRTCRVVGHPVRWVSITGAPRQGEKFQASATRGSAPAERQGYMTVLVYAHAEHLA